MVTVAGDPGAADCPENLSRRQKGSSYTAAILKIAPQGIL
jgi:hypothetical protein